MNTKTFSTTALRFYIMLSLSIVILLLSLVSDFICPYSPYEQNLDIALESPSAHHIMGTDQFGRDIFSRVLVGSKISIFSSLAAVVIVTVMGSTLGILSGYYGSRADSLIMKLCSIFLSFPGLVFALAFSVMTGGGILSAILSLSLIRWPKYCRLSRNQTLEVKQNLYIKTAMMSGDSDCQIIIRHILPNILDSIIVTSFLDIGTMMMEMAGLSFLGLGARAPSPEWGSMINSGRSYLQTSPYLVMCPGLAIFVCVVVFNLLSDSFRDYIFSIKPLKGK